MSSRALVLGGGGPVGIAWESGLIAGLAESGIDLSGADFIVGTSAGSVVGAQIAMGRTPAALVEPFLGKEEMTPPVSYSMSKPPDLSQLVAKLMESYSGLRPNEEVCREIGAWALQASVVSEEAFVASFGRSLGLPEERVSEEGWPQRRFACTAVDTVSGEFVRWDNDSGVPLVRAIASSCAVPGIASPISINGRRYMDGGMRSATNADLAKGYDVVVVVSISSQAVPEAFRRPLERELQALRDSGSRVEIVNPDAESFQAFGPNLMDFGRRPAAAANGMRQGKAGLDTLRNLWMSKV
jgi:NTE family protein